MSPKEMVLPSCSSRSVIVTKPQVKHRLNAAAVLSFDITQNKELKKNLSIFRICFNVNGHRDLYTSPNIIRVIKPRTIIE